MDAHLELGISLGFNTKENVKTDFLIIGGGVAGLSAANRLAESGANVVLLEQGSYPVHKICGEFLSPEALPILEKWEIPLSDSIDRIEILTSSKKWHMVLPEKAATATRIHLDKALADRAIKLGAQVMTGAQVENISPPTVGQPLYQVTLTTGEVWNVPHLLISSGRLSGKKKPSFCYVGFKAHSKIDHFHHLLKMHLFNNAYVGMAPIGNGSVNVAGLIRCRHDEAINPQAVLKQFLKDKSFPDCDWMAAPVPEFGIRHTPNWPRAYFLGDAAGVIPPATGNGLSLGLTSGILAAECALQNAPDAYRLSWKEAYAKRIKNGMLLHRLFLSPVAASLALAAAKYLPSIAYHLYRSTRS